MRLPTRASSRWSRAVIARVTGLDAPGLVEDDPLLGQPVRHFAALGGIAKIVPGATLAAIGL